MNRDEVIDQIIANEWEMFQQVNEGGPRASCQDNPQTFFVMRSSQYAPWSDEALLSYLQDLSLASVSGANLVELKYIYMMEYTEPERFKAFKDNLPPIKPRAYDLADEITGMLMEQNAVAASKYPKLVGRGRPRTSDGDSHFDTSAETYQRCELLTYSENTLNLLRKSILDLAEKGESFVEAILLATVKGYGFSTLEAAENAL